MPSFLEREQLLPVAPSIAPADQVLGAFGTRQSLFGIGASQLKSAYNSYSTMPLTNQQNQMQLDGLLKEAGTNIKKASVSDLSVGDNQSAAMSAFDPIIKDPDIMADAALTKGWNAGRSRADADRISSGGKRFNSASLDAINYQQQLYAKSSKDSWRAFYNNRESYSPYYDTTDEMGKLQKMFKTDVIEKDQQNGAYITTTKDSSWYKDKWQQFVEANASPQLKAQISTQSRAEYYRDMLTMPKDAIIAKYTGLRNELLKKQMRVDAQNMMNIGASLAMFHDSKDNSPLRSQLLAQASYLNDQYSKKKQAFDSPLEGADALGDVNNLAIGSRIAEGLGQHSYFDKVGDAFAHKEEKISIKPDYAYLSLKKLQEQSREFGIRQSEIGRHNRALEQHASNMEQIDLIKAQAAIMRAKGSGKKGIGDDEEDNNPSNSTSTGLQNTNSVSPAGNSEKAQTQGQSILDHLGNTQKQYNDVYDNVSSAVFSPQLMNSISGLANDPSKAGLKLTDVPDPTTATDGTGGNRSRLLKFIVAAGALDQDAGGQILGNLTGDKYDPETAAKDLTVADARQLLRTIFSDPKMLQKGIAAIKGNDPSINSYAIAAEIEKRKQRIDGEHTDIISQAIPLVKTNLERYSSLFESDFFSKGKIPTKDEVRKIMQTVPLSVLKDQTPNPGVFKSPQFKSQEDYYRDLATDNVMKTILGTLGNNRTAYNTQYQDYFPAKGNAQADNAFKNNLQTLIEGAQTQTKGLPSGVLSTLDYARHHPSAVEYVRMNSVDEAHDTPWMQIYFKTPSSAAERALVPESGIGIPTTNANDKFRQVPLDDRTTLLNNKALKFQVTYNDGKKSNLSIYNSSGDKSNPMFDINPDFSYQTLDIDRRTGDIKGIVTVHKADEVNNLTQGRPQLFSQAIGLDPTQVYNTLANKLIKNRDAVDEYMKANGRIKNINDLPEYIKTALKNNSF